MTKLPVTAWRAAVAAWICVIFFSSTSLASDWCEGAFNYLSGLFFNQLSSHTPSYDLLHILADKGLHVTLFAVLAILLWNALRKRQRKFLSILVWGAAIGSCSEFLQRFFPGRDPAVRDVLINIGGTMVGLAISTVARNRFWRPPEDSNSCYRGERANQPG